MTKHNVDHNRAYTNNKMWNCQHSKIVNIKIKRVENEFKRTSAFDKQFFLKVG